MPNSRLLVAIKPLSSPRFNPVSAAILESLANEPWWIEIGKSMSQTLKLEAKTSEIERVLVNKKNGFAFAHVIADNA